MKLNNISKIKKVLTIFFPVGGIQVSYVANLRWSIEHLWLEPAVFNRVWFLQKKINFSI